MHHKYIRIMSGMLLGCVITVTAGKPTDALAAPLVAGTVKANKVVVGRTKAGKINIKDAVGSKTIELQGSSGNIVNSFGGEGVIKGWAMIAADGSVIDCYRCDKLKTQHLGAPGSGSYSVDFTPVSTDIRGRPRFAFPDKNDNPFPAGFPELGIVQLQVTTGFGGLSAFLVATFDVFGPVPLTTDMAFTVILY